MTISEVVTVRGLRKVYGERIVVDELDLDVGVGEIVGLIGANGAGKTTTVECIQGLRRPARRTSRTGAQTYGRDMFRAALILICWVLGAGAIAGCGISEPGPHTAQSRDVPTFDRVELNGSANVVIRRAPSPMLTVSGGRNRVHDLITQVHAGTLIIKPPDTSATMELGDRDVTVTATSPTLTGVSVNGSGDITMLGLDAPQLRAQVNGSGDVAATGNVAQLDGAVAGSGQLRLRQLTAQRAKVTIAGSGNATVNTQQTLSASINGSGHITYHGEPRVSRSISGSGNITRA